jgi:nucleoside-diphosphate-sugar epimerase
MSRVLVTGGSGFIGGHCILELLAERHHVRTTIRNIGREGEVRAMLAAAGAEEPGERLVFIEADLTSDAGWAEAVEGCDYVLHVASPFPAAQPKHEDELIIPARDGALRVLRAARDGHVKRVVLTSSYAAIGYGAPGRSTPFTEEDWTDLRAPGIQPYVKSKTIAERAAWDFIESEGHGLELCVINPVGVFGPVLSKDFSTSILIVQRLMDGSVPGCPKLTFGVVDVRDVADLHIRAMRHPAAAGQRFLAIAGRFITIRDIALILKRVLGPAARRVPTWEIPDWVVRLVARFDPEVRQLLPELGKTPDALNEKARKLLGWAPRSNEEAVVDTARSLIAIGVLKP